VEPSLPTAAALRKALRAAARPGDREFLGRFFKAGPGEYAEGDRFLGVRVPDTRRLVKRSDAVPAAGVWGLVESPFHEERLLGLLIWVRRFERADEKGRREIYRGYLARREHINNWDLVDTSAPAIVGGWLRDHPAERGKLTSLARSAQLWDRRIAMLATFAFLRAGDFGPTLDIAELLVGDRHDLIHKAVGWMLREAGKRDPLVLREFLQRHAATMPRTALRYAIERLPAAERRRWMTLKARQTATNPSAAFPGPS
jgi:3-methyladenine DNA glycosylase AlkD